MMEQILTISLMVTAIHVCTWDGMIFGKLASCVGGWLSRIGLSVLRKPLYECITCMGGVWTLVIYPLLYGLSWRAIPVMLGVIGLNTIIGKFLHYGEEND